MTRVFVSGSRSIGRLNEKISQRLENLISQGLEIVIGDASGADKAVQKWLADRGYAGVTVYCSGGKCRNNLGNWPVTVIPVEASVKGRAGTLTGS